MVQETHHRNRQSALPRSRATAQTDSHMKIRDSVAFVTGANRGLGLAFVQELLAAGARKVYAAARDPKSITLLAKILDLS